MNPIAAPAAETSTNSFDQAMTDAAAFLARSLSSLLRTTFAELSDVKTADVGSSAFLSTYAAGSGIAMFVLVIMVARLFYRTSAGEMSGRALADSLWRWAPGAMLLVVFGPALGQLVVQLIDAATASIAGYFGGDLRSLPGRLTSMVVIDDPGKLPGGPIVALLVMAVAFVGVAGLVGGLVAQTMALYLTGAIMAVAFVAMVDPATRSRALRLPATWLGLLLAKPLLFFLTGTLARLVGSAFGTDADADPGWKLLMPALTGAAALLFVGLAPWSLVKVVPSLPTPRSGRPPRGAPAGSAGASAGGSATMLQLSYRRMHDLSGRQAAGAVTAVASTASPTAPSARTTAAASRAGLPTRNPEAPPPVQRTGPDAEEPNDPTAVAPFGEQAIDAAPPAVPQLVRRGGEP